MHTICVRRRRGRIRHAVSEGADCAHETLCGRVADGFVVDDRGVSCRDCLAEIERLGWSVDDGR